MRERLPVTSPPEPLEVYAQHFDPRFSKRTQRASFRRYLEGLLLPAERNKPLTALANRAPTIGAQHAHVQSWQWLLSEATWNAASITQQRRAWSVAQQRTVPQEHGALVIDETGDRKDGPKTAFVGRQYLGSIGTIDNGLVS